MITSFNSCMQNDDKYTQITELHVDTPAVLICSEKYFKYYLDKQFFTKCFLIQGTNGSRDA